MKKYIGIDLGGKDIIGGVIQKDGVILSYDTIKSDFDSDTITKDIVDLVKVLIAKAEVKENEIEGIGMGVPGMIDSENGVVSYAGNLGWDNFPIAYQVAAATGYMVKITNNANATALGEAKFGAGKAYKDSILVVLSAGVGGGIVINGKMFSGRHSQGGEIGHMVIEKDGLLCSCGRRGCLEMYASANALLRETKKAMAENTDCEIWNEYTPETIEPCVAFKYAKTDRTAKKVIDNYISYLACGLVNLANIFRPDVIMIGGIVSEEGEDLYRPLQAKFDEQIFAGKAGVPVPIVKASLGKKSGILGAAEYFIDEAK